MSTPETLKDNHEVQVDNNNNGWSDLAANADNFDPVAAEANRANDSEKMESVSTDDYEKEILALGDMFEKPTSLSEGTKEEIDEFLMRQDRMEQRIETMLGRYNEEPDNQVSKMKGEELPLPSRFDLMKNLIDGDYSCKAGEYADLIKAWLESDDGDDKEKRYRAFMRVRLDGPGIKRWELDRSGRLKEARIYKTLRPYSLKDVSFDDTLSSKYSALSDGEKAKRWQEAEEGCIAYLKERRKLREQRGEAASAANVSGNGLKKETNNDEQKPIESSSLPDQGPNSFSPFFNEYPMDPFNSP